MTATSSSYPTSGRLWHLMVVALAVCAATELCVRRWNHLMGWGYNDIYVLAPCRSADAVSRFLDDFVPNREPSAAEYRFPEGADHAEAIFQDPSEAIAYGAERPQETQRFYFRSTGAGEPAHAMVFLTADGGMVLGVSVVARQEDRSREASEVASWLGRLSAATGANVGYALHESCPPCDTVAEFVGGLCVALPPKLVNGQLILPEATDELGVVWLDWTN
jgi:hypothetical protein